MYKLHLVLKYLRKRRIAWVSLIAVILCTAMVLVVISVMGGWLRMFEENFRRVTGDVVISAKTLRGFGYYEQMVPELEKLPEVTAAVPVIQAYGLLNINNQKSEGVQVIGYPLGKIGKVNQFPKSLYWQYQRLVDAANAPGVSSKDRAELLKKAEASSANASFSYTPLGGQELDNLKEKRANWPGLIIGSGLLEIRKDRHGRMSGRDLWKYSLPATLILFDVEAQSFENGANISRRAYWIADDSHTGAWQFDGTSVYLPFDVAQKDMGMDAQKFTNAQGEPIIRPARTHELHVRVKPGSDLKQVKAKIQTVVDRIFDNAVVENERIGAPMSWTLIVPVVETWREKNGMYLSAVENEKVLVVFLFSMISIVAVFLIFCIFYMIVVEKTKDIGIIKSVGATSSGVAGIFLGYGLAIGIVGGGLGFLVGYLIIRNINYLHQLMGQWMGIEIWKPEVYVFDTIPNTIDPKEATIIVAAAIISSVVGAMVPAIRAARMNPVEAVRYE